MKLVVLRELPFEPNIHNPKITKKVLIKKGQVPHLTNLTQATFPPGELASAHSHSDMVEIFFVQKGRGTININEKPYTLEEGTCVTIEVGNKHELINSSSEDLVITYMGIEL